VRHMCERGVRQFVGLGTAAPIIHEAAHAIVPEARVVYVNDGRSPFPLDGRIGVVRADVGRPADVLAAAETRRLIDFGRPVGLLACGVLHLVPRAESAMAAYRAVLAPGGMLAVTHPTARNATKDGARPPDQIAVFFDGLRLLPPGLVPVWWWRPDPGVDAPPGLAGASVLAGVGRLEVNG
jgi:hypothetical protein